MKNLLLAAMAGLIAQTQGCGAMARGMPGHVPAEIVSVQDGDTFRARAHVWPGLDVLVLVRVAGIDAPELRARCPKELRLAEAARDEMIARLPVGGQVRLSAVRRDKYAGRILAVVTLPDGRDLAAGMLERGLARRYEGGARKSWCE